LTRKEYNQSVALYSDAIYGFLLKQLSNEMEAEDIVQNTFEKLWKNIESVPLSKAKSYLFTVAYRNMIDFTRKQKLVRSQPVLLHPIVDDIQDRLEKKELLELGLKQLSDIQQSLILLRDYEGYSYEEIADISDLSLSQVKVYLFRARKKLQQYITNIDQSVQYNIK